MKTVQMTLDEDLVIALDKVVKELGTNRSAYASGASLIDWKGSPQ